MCIRDRNTCHNFFFIHLYGITHKPSPLLRNLYLTKADCRKPRPSNGKYSHIITQPNIGKDYSLECVTGKSVIDLTLAYKLKVKTENWRVYKAYTGSNPNIDIITNFYSACPLLSHGAHHLIINKGQWKYIKTDNSQNADSTHSKKYKNSRGNALYAHSYDLIPHWAAFTLTEFSDILRHLAKTSNGCPSRQVRPRRRG